MPRPDLRWDRAPGSPDAVVLVLHGGQESSLRAVRWSDPAVLRMWPVAKSTAHAGGERLAVARLRYAVRGWNGPAASPLVDTRAALDDVGRRYPGRPIALVGHSMGGRVALALAGDERVRHVVGLAPWVEEGDPVRPHPGLRLLVVHGMADRVTSPTASRRLVESLQPSALVASFVGLRAEGHAMLRRWRTWDQLTSGSLMHALTTAPHAPAGFAALGARASSEGLTTVV